jgi:hypothetical protein
MNYTDDYYGLEDARAEAAAERRRRILLTRCQCGTDLPGTCPGPANCPMACGDDEED